MTTTVVFGSPMYGTSPKVRGFDVEVASSGTTSTAIPAFGYALVGFITPSDRDWETTVVVMFIHLSDICS